MDKRLYDTVQTSHILHGQQRGRVEQKNRSLGQTGRFALQTNQLWTSDRLTSRPYVVVILIMWRLTQHQSKTYAERILKPPHDDPFPIGTKELIN